MTAGKKSLSKPSLFQKVAGATLLIACLGSSQANSMSVDLTYRGPGFPNYQAASISKFDSSGAAISGTQSVSAGAFKMDLSNSDSPLFENGKSILAWCVDISQHLATSGAKTYTVDDTFDTASKFGNHGVTSQKLRSVQRLFNQHYSEILNASAPEARLLSAAMQLAVWEIVADNGSSAYSLTSGDFRATGAAQGKAQTWLTGLSTSQTTGNYRLVILNNKDHQDLITAVSAVPLPAAPLLFMSAIGLIGLARKKFLQ